MNKIEINIDGMMCGMCEAHVNDLFRRHIIIKKIKSNHYMKKTIIITEEDPSDELIKSSLEGSGYNVLNIFRTKARKTLLGYK
ncbi:MAG: heavy-metal-associated domain-containing protein [Acholeplasmatales bacterium]|nr:heavy-metal-associated domain-containing protein [Acholeplasmatales bacterium]